MLADSLLASPALAMLVLGEEHTAVVDLIADFKERVGEYVQVGGVGLLGDAADFSFVPLSLFEPHPRHIPLVRSTDDIGQVSDCCEVAVLQTADLDCFLTAVQQKPDIAWLPLGGIPSTAVADWRTAGAGAIAAPVWFDDDQRMPETITLVRRYNTQFL